jgi:hypothetical protein
MEGEKNQRVSAIPSGNITINPVLRMKCVAFCFHFTEGALCGLKRTSEKNSLCVWLCNVNKPAIFSGLPSTTSFDHSQLVI